MVKAKKLEGLIAAAHTPFRADGSVNVDLVPRQAALLLKQGVTGVYVSGTTGEGISCSVAERTALFDAWVRASRRNLHGRVLSRDPFDADMIVAGEDLDGIWLSRDNGETWRSMGLSNHCTGLPASRSTRPFAGASGRRHRGRSGRSARKRGRSTLTRLRRAWARRMTCTRATRSRSPSWR